MVDLDEKNQIKQKSKSKSKPQHDHNGHRQRIKKKFHNSGIDVLEDHEVVELLLYFAKPYGDTNNLAHDLLARYGSLSAMLEADYHDLLQVDGVGPHTATLFNFIPQIAGRYFHDRWKDRKVFANTADLSNYMIDLFVGKSVETFMMVFLNSRNQIKNVTKIAEGTISGVAIQVSQVVEECLRQKCRSVIIAHNHPGGSLKPSKSDYELTENCIEALDKISVHVLDHIIVAGREYCSFVEDGYMQNIRNALDKKKNNY